MKIEDLIKSFKNDGDEYNWEHTIEGTLHSFLGIEISTVERTTVDKHGNKKIMKHYKFSQKGLIEKILRTTGMMTCNKKGTPTC